jgi:ATP-dependent exoDNAse (exonuclease V) alpha subunit
MQPWGTYDLNRDLQRHFRAAEIDNARNHATLSYGPEDIVLCGKVILIRNRKRPTYQWSTKTAGEDYFANGEVGLVATTRKNRSGAFFNIAFAGRNGIHVSFNAVPGHADAPDLEPMPLSLCLRVL